MKTEREIGRKKIVEERKIKIKKKQKREGERKRLREKRYT